MIDTRDLTSYYPGYDEYCERQEKLDDKCDYESILADIYHDEMKLREEKEKMGRNIIDLTNTNMTFDEIMNLKNYVWKGSKLIPVELLEGE